MSNTSDTRDMKQLHHDGHGLNDLVTIVADACDPAAGNASHGYTMWMRGARGTFKVAEITYQHGPRCLKTSTPGILDEALLAVLIDRQESFKAGPFSGPHNAIILEHLYEALKEMKDRADERAERRVLGKNVK